MSRVQLLSPPPLFNLETQAVSNDLTNREAVLVCGDSQETTPNTPSLRSSVRSKNSRFLTCSQAAKLLGISTRTVLTWCETGRLIATPKPYGRKIQWEISPEAVELSLFKAKEDCKLSPKGLK